MKLPNDLTPSKPIFKSKTAATSVLLVLASFVPQARELFSANPQLAMLLTGVVYGVLRLVTKGRVTLYTE